MAELFGADYKGKIYPGRLNERELEAYREQESYEHILTDLVLMGIITEEQKQQYCHRYTQSYDKPLLPQLPTPHVPVQFDPITDGGKILGINSTTGKVEPELETTIFHRIFPGHVGNWYGIDPDGYPPPEPGIDDGDFYYMLVWNGQWDMIEWMWSEQDASWTFDAAEIVPAINFQYIMTYDGDARTTSHGEYVLLTGNTQASLPTWQPLTPQALVLPDVWIDVPLTTFTATSRKQQVNLATGKLRQKNDGYDLDHPELWPNKVVVNLGGKLRGIYWTGNWNGGSSNVQTTLDFGDDLIFTENIECAISYFGNLGSGGVGYDIDFSANAKVNSLPGGTVSLEDAMYLWPRSPRHLSISRLSNTSAGGMNFYVWCIYRVQ
jgi:hypothetical protein